uniref:GNAT family N-acetyltransferase n=1 Tax=Geobacter metallireducens TaxID=28232 RepID=A0A831U1U7_GEOME
MTIRTFVSDDVPRFLALAAAEGWTSDPWEFDFLLEHFPGGCLTLEEGGKAQAFVTALPHGTSGWIGNLIVAPDARGRGYGTLLMERAMDELLAAGVTTVWLTASLAGRPIYERMGFREIDQVARWSGRGRGQGERGDLIPLGRMVAMDRAGWGDVREPLLSAVVSRGSLLGGADGFLVVQPCGSGVQLGPWSCGDRGEASSLLGRVIGPAADEIPVILDVPVRNGAAAALLTAAGFSTVGRTALMYAGVVPAYDPTRIFALASMGSMG